MKATPAWLLCLDLICVLIAGGLWSAIPQVGAWPLILALTPWAIRLALTGQLTRTTPFDPPLILFLFTASLSVWAAYNRQPAWSKFWLIIGGILFFYALVNAERLAQARTWLLAGLNAGIAAFFLLAHDWNAYLIKLEVVVRLGKALQAPFSWIPRSNLNPNEVGGILAMLLPFTGLVVVQTWQAIRRSPEEREFRWKLGLAVGLLGISAFGLLMTNSRGAWIGLASALLLASVWIGLGRFNRNSLRTWLFLGLLLLLAGGIVTIQFLWPKAVSTILEALPGTGTGLNRLEFQFNSLSLVRDYPFIGAGLNSFEMLYSTYVMLIHVGFIEHSHSLFLGIAIEQGMLALLALVWMWLLFGRTIWKTAMRPNSQRDGIPYQPAALGAAALSLVVILVHGLVETAMYGRAGTLLLFVPLAFAVPTSGMERRQNGKRLAVGLAIGIALLAIAALAWGGPLLSLAYSNLGAVHQSQTELSVYHWPEWPIQDEVRRVKDLSQPVSEFERALSLNPQNATANRRLGMIELSLGEYEEALRHLETAYSSEANSLTTRQLLGEALIVNGQMEKGTALWASVNNEQDQLGIRKFWYQHIGDTQRAEWIHQAANSR